MIKGLIGFFIGAVVSATFATLLFVAMIINIPFVFGRGIENHVDGN